MDQFFKYKSDLGLEVESQVAGNVHIFPNTGKILDVSDFNLQCGVI